ADLGDELSAIDYSSDPGSSTQTGLPGGNYFERTGGDSDFSVDPPTGMPSAPGGIQIPLPQTDPIEDPFAVLRMGSPEQFEAAFAASSAPNPEPEFSQPPPSDIP
ncbi:MAG: hypothetical protein KC561_12110, partial [Myxococcales bacterium]|nr:hypothetical protein [Myxococcales bacterium]